MRRSTWIVAEDKLSGRKIRCEVFVDRIARIEIETTTRVMYKAEKEVLDVLAFDAHGNKFSTVAGLAFHWSIVPTEADAGTHAVLQLVPFSGSSYEVAQRLRDLEAAGLMGDSVLVEGVGTGRANVVARLAATDDGSTAVGIDGGVSTVVQLSVIEPLELLPRHAIYVTPGTQIQYVLRRVASNSAADAVIAMPNAQYEWSVSNATLLSIDSAGVLTVRRGVLGEADVKVAYARMQENYYTAPIFVVQPARVALQIVELAPSDAASDAAGAADDAGASGSSSAAATGGSSAYLTTARRYRISAVTFDADNHLLHARSTDALRFSIVLDAAHFEVVSRSANGARVVVRTRELAVSSVVSATVAWDASESLAVRQSVLITEPVRVVGDGSDDNTVLLPCDVVGKHQAQLVGRGGSGHYEWRSASPAVATVNEQGVLIVHAPGRTRVTLADKLNLLNMFVVDVLSVAATTRAVDAFLTRHRAPGAEAELERERAAGIGSLPVLRASALALNEVEVGDVVDVRALLVERGAAGRAFTNCSGLALEWRIKDAAASAAFVAADGSAAAAAASSGAKGECATRRFRAVRPGRTQISVGYDDLLTEIELFAYDPLRLAAPSDAAPLVTLGATATVTFVGGPRGWYSDVDAQLDAPQPSAIAIEALPAAAAAASTASTPRRSFRLTCLSLHEQRLTLRISKGATPRNPSPPTVTATVDFRCQAPHSVFVYPPREQQIGAERAAAAAGGRAELADAPTKVPSPRWFDAASFDSAAASASTHVVPTTYQLRNGRTIPFRVAVLNEAGEMFQNASTLAVDWFVVGGSSPLAHWSGAAQHERALELSASEGDVRVGVDARHYDVAALRAAGVRSDPVLANKHDGSVLRREYQLHLVRNLFVEPPVSVLLNVRDNARVLRAAGGSGSYRFELVDAGIVRLERVLDAGTDGAAAAAAKQPLADDGSATATTTNSAVRVVPLRVGVARVRVVDVALEGADAVEAVVRVSDVAEVRVSAPRAVEHRGAAGALVQLLDERGVAFDVEQAVLAAIEARVDGSAATVVRVADNDTIANALVFEVRGNHVGTATVTVGARLRDERLVQSKPLSVEVYAPVRLLAPTPLVLLPGSSFQLTHRGGPPGADVRFEVADAHVAALESDVLTAAVRADGAAGRTTLFVVIDGQRSQSTVDVIVLARGAAERDVRIVAPAVRVLEGDELSVHVEAGGATPHAFGDAEFRWQSASPDVAGVIAVHSAADVSLEREASFAARVVGRSAGQARITVSTRAFGEERVVATRQFEVVQRLRLLVPSELLLPPHATVQVRTNKHGRATLSYTLCGDVVALDQSTGTVRASGRTGVAALTVCDDADGQCVAVSIAVRPVHHLQLLPAAGDAAAAVQYDVPVGATQAYRVVLHDELGAPLSVVGDWAFDADVNAPDVAAVTNGLNGTFLVRGQQPGSAVVRVFAVQAPHMVAFVRVQVATVLRPLQPIVHVGGTVQFSLHAAAASAAAAAAVGDGSNATDAAAAGGAAASAASAAVAQWSVEDERVAIIDPRTGELTARAAGVTTVYHRSSLHSYTRVTVVTVSKLQLDASAASFVTNAVSRDTGLVDTYRVPVRFEDEAGHVLGGGDGVVRHRLRLTCSAEPATWVEARAARDEASGAYYCDVRPLPLSQSQLRRTKPIDAIEVVAAASDVTGETRATAHKSLSFVPAFVIVNRPDGDGVLRLHRGRTTAFLEVYGARAASLIVKSSDATLLRASTLRSPAAESSFTTLYELAVLRPSAPFSDVTIEFVNYATGQTDSVHVSYTLDDPAELAAREARDAAAAVPLLQGGGIVGQLGDGADDRVYRRAIDASTGLPVTVQLADGGRGDGHDVALGLWSYATMAFVAVLSMVLFGVVALILYIMCYQWLQQTLRRTLLAQNANGAGGAGGATGVRPAGLRGGVSGLGGAQSGAGAGGAGAGAGGGDPVFVPASPFAPASVNSMLMDPGMSPNVYRSPFPNAGSSAYGSAARRVDAAYSPPMSPFVTGVRKRPGRF